MGIFNNTDKSSDKSSRITVIAAGTEISGVIKTDDTLHIDGLVSGEVHCSGIVKIGVSGIIDSSNITVQELIVSGQCNGNINSVSIFILPGGKIGGDITYQNISIADGGLIEGKMTQKQILESSEPKLLEEKKPETANATNKKKDE